MTGYEALSRLRITSSTSAASLGTEGQRLGLLLSQSQIRGPLTSFRITQHHALIIEPNTQHDWLEHPSEIPDSFFLGLPHQVHPDELRPAHNPWGYKCVGVLCQVLHLILISPDFLGTMEENEQTINTQPEQRARHDASCVFSPFSQ